MAFPADLEPTYRCVAELGRGGMGVVYRAIHTALDRHVAIKVLASDVFSEPDLRARFIAEAKLAVRVAHPGVVLTLDSGISPAGTAYIAYEYLEGQTLEFRLKRDGRISERESTELAVQVLEGLEAIHAAGIVHRDLKPGNIMLLPGGGAKVIDFGIARDLFDAHVRTKAGMILGTPAYLSPESITGEAVGPSSDIYALGVILFEMVTGRLPFEGASLTQILSQHVNTPAPRPDAVSAAVSAALSDQVVRALDKRPAGRFASAADFRMALEALLSSAWPEVSGATAAVRLAGAGPRAERSRTVVRNISRPDRASSRSGSPAMSSAAMTGTLPRHRPWPPVTVSATLVALLALSVAGALALRERGGRADAVAVAVADPDTDTVIRDRLDEAARSLADFPWYSQSGIKDNQRLRRDSLQRALIALRLDVPAGDGTWSKSVMDPECGLPVAVAVLIAAVLEQESAVAGVAAAVPAVDCLDRLGGRDLSRLQRWPESSPDGRQDLSHRALSNALRFSAWSFLRFRTGASPALQLGHNLSKSLHDLSDACSMLKGPESARGRYLEFRSRESGRSPSNPLSAATPKVRPSAGQSDHWGLPDPATRDAMDRLSVSLRSDTPRIVPLLGLCAADSGRVAIQRARSVAVTPTTSTVASIVRLRDQEREPLSLLDAFQVRSSDDMTDAFQRLTYLWVDLSFVGLRRGLQSDALRESMIRTTWPASVPPISWKESFVRASADLSPEARLAIQRLGMKDLQELKKLFSGFNISDQ